MKRKYDFILFNFLFAIVTFLMTSCNQEIVEVPNVLKIKLSGEVVSVIPKLRYCGI